jgi:hypothetical protein
VPKKGHQTITAPPGYLHRRRNILGTECDIVHEYIPGVRLVAQREGNQRNPGVDERKFTDDRLRLVIAAIGQYVSMKQMGCARLREAFQTCNDLQLFVVGKDRNQPQLFF